MSKQSVQKPAEMSAGTVDVTPELACDWLALNTHNRPLREMHVKWLARMIANGEWVLNGESIKFNTRGVLVDGQHRLAAIAMTGITVPSIVVYNAPLNSFQTIDIGKKRSPADAFALLGETHCTALAATLANLWRYQQKNFTGFRLTPSTAALIDLLNANPGIREAVHTSSAWANRARCADSVLAFCFFLFREKDSDLAEHFMRLLAEGTGLEAGSPILRLRERFISNRESKLKLGTPELIALVIKAWNYWRVGREMQVLSWRYRAGEEFPVPQ